MTDFDSPWKDALDRFFPSFLAFFFPDIHADVDWSRGYEMLDKELRQIVREAELGRRHVDKLAKVWRRDGEETWVLIHIEVQSQPDADFPKRMYVYNYRLFDRYNRTVVSLGVLADDRTDWRPHQFQSSLWGCTTSIEFPVVKLLDYAADEAALEKDANPFATLVLAHVKTLQTRESPEGRRAWKMRIVRGLYERGLSRRDVQELFRFIDWIMDLPAELNYGFWTEVQAFEREKQMPYVTSVERMAETRGVRKGRVVGLRQGLALALEARFGAPGKKLTGRIRRISDLDTLRALCRAFKRAANLDEFREALP